MAFDEATFLRALTERPADAKRFSQFFQPQWLESAPFRPILQEIYNFTLKYDTPPRIPTLRSIFVEKDKLLYENRMKDALDLVEEADRYPDSVQWCLDKAREAGISNSLKYLMEGAEFEGMLEHHEGGQVIELLDKWRRQFDENTDLVEKNIKEASEELLRTRGTQTNEKIPTSIEFLDDWCGGGLRKKQCGLLLGSTGSGKSSLLSIIAFKTSSIQKKNVLYVTNELSIPEITERFMALMTGASIDAVINNLDINTGNLEKHWEMGTDKRLRLVQVNSEVSMATIESIMSRYKSLYGYDTDVLVLDYLERMCPIDARGYQRNQTWEWLKGVAQDLVRMNKRRNILTWTAAQINRSGFGATDLTLAHAQGSVKHLQEVDAVIAFQTVPSIRFDNPDLTALQFQALKMRQSKRKDNSIVIEADLGRMSLGREVHDRSEFSEMEEEYFQNKDLNKAKKKERKRKNDDTSDR